MLALLLLAGCQKSFDDRYADAQKKLNEQAASIDKDLTEKASEAALAPAVAVNSPAPASAPVEPPHRIPRP